MYKITESTISDQKVYLIETTFKMKDSLKKAIPSAKWSSEKKSWYVGSRSLKKLATWVEEAKKEFGDEAKIKAQHDAFLEKVENSTRISGHTFDYKELLKERFGAFFYKEHWHVPNDMYAKAQKTVDALNEIRKRNLVFKNNFKKMDRTELLNELIKISNKNFSETSCGSHEYNYKDDDFYKELCSYSDGGHYAYQQIRSLISELNTVAYGVDEDQMFEHKYSDKIGNAMLEFFGIPRVDGNRLSELYAVDKISLEEAEAVKNDAIEKSRALNEKRDLLLKTAYNIIDVVRIRELHKNMCSIWGKYTSKNHNRYDEYREELKKYRDDLRKAGMRIKELDELITCNWNRADRDNPKLIDNDFNTIRNE